MGGGIYVKWKYEKAEGWVLLTCQYSLSDIL